MVGGGLPRMARIATDQACPLFGGRLTPTIRPLLATAAWYAVMRLEHFVILDRPPYGDRVTPRELAVLRALSLGVGFKQAAEQLGISVETARTHLKKVKDKLWAKNMVHADVQG
jgi:DNA-binding NarL/FixJ family response regulator